MELQARAAAVALAQAELHELQTAWEHRQAITQARRNDEEAALRRAESQRDPALQQLATLRQDMEHIARALYDDAEPPRLEQAA